MDVDANRYKSNSSPSSASNRRYHFSPVWLITEKWTHHAERVRPKFRRSLVLGVKRAAVAGARICCSVRWRAGSSRYALDLVANTVLLWDVSITGDAVSAATGRARPPNRKHHHQTNARKPVTPYRYALANSAGRRTETGRRQKVYWAPLCSADSSAGDRYPSDPRYTDRRRAPGRYPARVPDQPR